MLKLEHVTLTYPDGGSRLTALKNVDLTVASGEFVAITGPSGSGKSSLLSVAATLTPVDSGEVTVAGSAITSLSQRAKTKLRREKLGIIFQAPNLLPALTVAEQLEVMARLDGRKMREQEIVDLLAEVDLADHSRKRPGQLSGGQRQRVNIARALVNNPAVLLVDEPTSALDSGRSSQVMRLLGRLTKERQLAAVVVTHDTEQLRWCDAEYRMVDGELSRVG